MLSRFHLIPERNGQTDRRTDGQTDRFAIAISRVSMLTRDKNSAKQGNNNINTQEHSKSANLRQRQNFNQKSSGIQSGLPD